MNLLYKCVTCGGQFRSDEVVYLCPECTGGSSPGTSATAGVASDKAAGAAGFQKGILSMPLDVPAARARIAGRRSDGQVDPHMLLPFAVGGSDVFPAGDTPVIEPARLRRRTGFPNLYFKDDSRNPSGSLKDRASLLVAEQAMLQRRHKVVLASTGNAGASMACAGAAYSLDIILFIPENAPREKYIQALSYGARVVPISGSYDDAFILSIEYTKEFGGINRNTGYNPYTIEGKKTVSIEIYNQLGCRVPDYVFIPAGDGVVYSGVCKGFSDLAEAGIVDRIPKLILVQAEGSNAISRSWRESGQVVLSRVDTRADSIAVASPACGEMAMECLQISKGTPIEVSDAEIGHAQLELGKQSGLFVEPSSAAAWAGFLNAKKDLDPQATVVVLLTGTGFKDMRAAEELVDLPPSCHPDPGSARKFLCDVYGD